MSATAVYLVVLTGAVLQIAIMIWILFWLFAPVRPAAAWHFCAWCRHHWCDDGRRAAFGKAPQDCPAVTHSHGICPRCFERELGSIPQVRRGE